MQFIRPRWHFTPPRGWMNDPCAPFQDDQGVYHCYYQWVPESTEWSREIGWGHAWSADGVRWMMGQEPVLMPGVLGSFDHMGVFTGALHPGSRHESQLAFVYSAINDSVNEDQGYTNGQERLALAMSNDGGKTLKRDKELLKVMPPAGVTGWRDPFISSSEILDRVTDHSNGTYVFVAGGLQSHGPTVFLYRLPFNDSIRDSLTGEWEDMGPFITPMRRRVPPRSSWVGDLGDNWECPSFVTLGSLHVVIIGSEGKWVDLTYPNSKIPSWQIWFAGDVVQKDGRIHFDINSEGILDWGNFYAAQVFKANDGRTLSTGWLVDNDLTDRGRRRQGWAGAMSCLRELFEQTTLDVIGALSSPVQEIPHFIAIGSPGNGAVAVHTLGIKPALEVLNAFTEVIGEQDLTLLHSTFMYELSTLINNAEFVGVRLQFAGGSAQILFLPREERIVIQRDGSCSDDDVNVDTEHGKHTLFQTVGGWEKLKLCVLYDNGILEIFANERFALSTRLYGGICRAQAVVDNNAGEVSTRFWTPRP